MLALHSQMNERKILIVIPNYLPGYRLGGPQQTVQNICDAYPEANIYLLTLNHDHRETEPYDVPLHTWLDLYGIKIMYVTDRDFNFSLFVKIYSQFNIIYTCGLFCSCSYKLIIIHHFSKINETLYVAPMGVFSPNALAVKLLKKKTFLSVMALIGGFKDIIWSFTSEKERGEAIDAIGLHNVSSYLIAEDLPRKVNFDYFLALSQKRRPGNLRVVFISRIVRKKNLDFALTILVGIQKSISFDIYGIIEDKKYWNECESLIQKVAKNIKVSYKGEVHNSKVVDTFAKYDVFLFPTENLGHVIYESLAAGCGSFDIR